MDAQSAVTRRLGIGLAVACAMVLSAGCAAGQDAQTSNEVPAIDATSGDLGTLALRAVAIKPPPNGVSYASGAVAELQLVVVNSGPVSDTLTTVSSSATSSIRLFATEAEASAAATATASSSATASGSTSPAGSGTASTSTSTSGSGSSSASASSPATSTSASSSAAPKPPSLAIPAGQVLSLGIGHSDAIVDLVLSKALFPGPSVPMTFTFANAGSITLHVPVQLTQQTGQVGISVPPLPSDSNAG